jgi:single-stranded DNA-binding protein
MDDKRFQNQVTIEGVLREDPWVTDTRSGTPVANIKLFYPVPHKRARIIVNGEESGDYMFLVRAYRTLAVKVEENVRAGNTIVVKGTLKQEIWNARDTGVPVNRVIVLADDIAVVSNQEEDDDYPDVPSED